MSLMANVVDSQKLLQKSDVCGLDEAVKQKVPTDEAFSFPLG